MASYTHVLIYANGVFSYLAFLIKNGHNLISKYHYHVSYIFHSFECMPKTIGKCKVRKSPKKWKLCTESIVDFKNFSVKEVVSKNVCLNLIKVN